MTEEQAVQTTGENVEAAAPQPDTANQDSNETRQVPLSALESERSQRQKAQDELKMMKEHLNLISARQQSQSQQPPQPQYDDDDVLTYGDFKKIAGEFQKDISGRLTELDMKQQYPDYQDVVTKYLPDILKQNPALRQDFESSPNFYRAYYLAKNSDAYKKEHHQEQRNADAERMIANSERSGSLSEMGGASPINLAKRYRDMSDTDFRKEVAKNMGYA